MRPSDSTDLLRPLLADRLQLGPATRFHYIRYALAIRPYGDNTAPVPEQADQTADQVIDPAHPGTRCRKAVAIIKVRLKLVV